MLLFISVGFFDILDIFLVAFLLYQLFMLIRGTVAINIFVGVFMFYLLWLIVTALKMSLLSSILGSFMGVGVIALIIVFQQEIRRFLLLLGNQEIFNHKFPFEKYLSKNIANTSKSTIKEIVGACRNMSKTNTGALIVFSTKSALATYTQTGDILNADVSHRFLETIFFKNSPMHDGAMIIIGDKIKAARCVLPIDDDIIMPPELGLRHRAAISMSNETDAIIVTVSEENGNISLTKNGVIKRDLSPEKLQNLLKKEFIKTES